MVIDALDRPQTIVGEGNARTGDKAVAVGREARNREGWPATCKHGGVPHAVTAEAVQPVGVDLGAEALAL